MKIAVIQDSLIRGGAERQAMYAVRELARLGCEVELIYYNQAPYAYDPFTILAPENLTFIPKQRTYARFLRRLRKYFRGKNFDVVHGFMGGPTIYGCMAGWSCGVPVVLGGIRAEYDVFGLQRLAHRFVNRIATGWIVNSQATARSMVGGVGAKLDRVFVVYNGIDPMSLKTTVTSAEAKGRLGLPSEALTVSIIGRLHPQKNHALFLEAAAKVGMQHPNAHFLIVGEGELRTQLLAHARTLSIADRIHFLGNRNDMPEIFAATDVCVLTSRYEGLANVLLESMFVGIPVVCTAYNGADELITDEQEGFIAPLGDASAVANRINRLLDDPALRQKMGQTGQASVSRRFTLEAMGRNMLSVYESCLREADSCAARTRNGQKAARN